MARGFALARAESWFSYFNSMASLAFLFLVAAGATKVSPVAKVIELLDELTAKATSVVGLLSE